MSGISSSTGLVSGLPTADLINQLMAIESRPLELYQQRISVLQAERTAFVQLSAQLLSLQNAAEGFGESDFFKVFQANSSDSAVLTATADKNATVGSFSFRVHSLVASHGLISRGFADADTTPVGSGTLTLEMGHGLLTTTTDLETLNGGEGVRRGRIEITDREGNSAEVDLTAALSVDDVLEAINSQTTISVRAGVDGDRIVLEDLNPESATGSLAVRDLGGGHTAEDLGIAQTSAEGRIQGADVIGLVDTTALAALNDGNGVGRAVAGSDFTIQHDDGSRYEVSLSGNIEDRTRLEVLNNGNGVRLGVIRITNRSGDSAEVDLTGAVNLQDVAERLQDAGLAIDVTYFNSSTQHALQLTDNSPGEGSLKIEDVSGFAARDLGIAAETEDGSLIGNGIHRVNTVGDVLRAVRYACDEVSGEYNDGKILADFSANGNGLMLTSVGIPRGFEVIADEDSTAAEDLGILGRYEMGAPPAGASRDLLAGLNTVLLQSLNGGSGVDTGVVRFSDRSGTTVDVDLGGAQTVQDVINLVNQAAADQGMELSASINSAGNGILIQDGSGATANPLQISDLSGSAAEGLGLAGTFAADRVDSGNLQLQYISERTLLSEFNNGRGVRTGDFQIIDAAGNTRVIHLTDSQQTVGDVIRLINASSDTVVASVNDTGDGILLTDNSGGEGTLQVEDLDGAYSAADLHLAGEAASGENTIDGSLELRIEIDASDTLQDVVNRINNAGGDISASVINDGGSTQPYRLAINSLVSGLRGRIVLDPGDTGLEFSTLVEPRDAVVFLGGADAENPVVLRSPTNTLSDVIEGVTINLTGTSDTPVDLSVTQDIEGVVQELSDFAAAYNAVIDLIDQQTAFDAESMQRGVLFGDSTVNLIEQRLFRSVTGSLGGDSQGLTRLSSIGITTSDGGRLQFDETTFREAYAENPEGVEELFTAEDTGFGAVFSEMLEELTRTGDGTLARRESTLEDQEELLNSRITAMEVTLEQKRARLESQFAGLETSLAALQDQQSALSVLQSLVG